VADLISRYSFSSSQ